MMYPSQIRNAEVVEAHCAFRITTKCVGSTYVRRGSLEDNQGRNSGAYRCKPCAMASFHANTAHLRPPTSVTRCCPVCNTEFNLPARAARRVERDGRLPCCSISCGNKQGSERRRVVPSHVQRFAKSTWTAMNIRCGNGRYRRDTKKNASYTGVLILVTREEYYDWCAGQADRIASLSRPSIDRVRKEGHYSLANMQIIELLENMVKDRLSFKDGMGTCYACHKTKLIESFAVDSRRVAVGHTTLCRACDRLRGRGRHQRATATSENLTLGSVPR